ncbi:MAG: YidB family protein [Verrucomicrobiota bacterium]
MDEIFQLAAEKFKGALSGETGQKLATGTVIPALQKLFTNSEGKLDLSAILKDMDLQGLAGIAQSWLGSGSNHGIDASAIEKLFGGKLSEFASQLGIQKDEAVQGLRAAVPEVVDKSSPDGNLMSQASGVINIVKGLF